MKTTNPTPETKPSEPARPDVAGLPGLFLYSYPYHRVRGRVTRICAALARYWSRRGFDVLGCVSIEHTLRTIRPGQVWIVWRGGSLRGRARLRVVGMREGLAPGG